MTGPRGFSLLLTAQPPADRPVTFERVPLSVGEEHLPIVGQDEDVSPAVRYPWKSKCSRLKREHAPSLGCGCCLSRSPLHLCRTGTSLLAASQLAEFFVSEKPGDVLYRKLADLTRDALTRHLTHSQPIAQGDTAHSETPPTSALPWPNGTNRATDAT